MKTSRTKTSMNFDIPFPAIISLIVLTIAQLENGFPSDRLDNDLRTDSTHVFPESDQRRVLVVYVFRRAQVARPGWLPSRCGRAAGGLRSRCRWAAGV